VYGLGAILYELLTGFPPFQGDSEVQVIQKVQHQTPTPLQELIPDIPEELALIVATAMAKDPKDRYPSAQAFAQALKESMKGKRRGWMSRVGRWAKEKVVAVRDRVSGKGDEIAEANWQRANVFIEIGDDAYEDDLYDQAERAYEEAIAISPKANSPNDKAYRQLGYIYLKRKEQNAALSAFTQSLNRNPNSPRALIERGKIYLRQGKVKKAKADFEQAIELSDQWEEAYFYLGLCFLSNKFAGDLYVAKENFRQALILNPNNEMARLWYLLIDVLPKHSGYDEEFTRFMDSLSGVERALIREHAGWIQEKGYREIILIRLKDKEEKTEQAANEEEASSSETEWLGIELSALKKVLEETEISSDFVEQELWEHLIKKGKENAPHQETTSLEIIKILAERGLLDPKQNPVDEDFWKMISQLSRNDAYGKVMIDTLVALSEAGMIGTLPDNVRESLFIMQLSYRIWNWNPPDTKTLNKIEALLRFYRSKLFPILNEQESRVVSRLFNALGHEQHKHTASLENPDELAFIDLGSNQDPFHENRFVRLESIRALASAENQEQAKKDLLQV